MKVACLLVTLASVASMASALDLSSQGENTQGLRKRVQRPETFNGVHSTGMAPKLPDTLAGVSVGLTKTKLSLSKASLQRLPAEHIASGSKDSSDVPHHLRRQSITNDLFQCRNDQIFLPSRRDCRAIVNQLFSVNLPLVLVAGRCVTFSYSECYGFFCSLCHTLEVTTNFIGAQLDTAELLCIENGQDGFVVGVDAPQWQAGFLYPGNDIPAYDVCY